MTSGRSRNGLSIMEVMFAIGVLVIGLLGIASILPVAARNASNALQADATTAAVENQVSNAIARITSNLTHVDVPSNSLVAYSGTASPYFPGFGPYSGLAPYPSFPSGATTFGNNQIEFGIGNFYNRVSLQTPILRTTISGTRVPAVTGIPVNGTAAGYRGLNFATVAPAAAAFPSDIDWFYDPISTQPNSVPVPRPSFCIDPAFLTAASNLRDDRAALGNRNVNGYDRTRFPCYDMNYDPTASPGDVLSSASFAMTPRMHRVVLPDNNSFATVRTYLGSSVALSERDELPLVRPTGELRDNAPGLLTRPSAGAVGPTGGVRTGKFSTMITLVPEAASGNQYTASIVVFESRQLAINPPGTVSSVQAIFNLEPHTTLPWADETAAAEERTYGEEVLGIVTAAPSLIEGGVGTFTYTHSATCNPEIDNGDWLMLARWDPISGLNRFAWYRVSDVLSGPELVAGPPSVYVTTIEVRGEDWLFHPSQVATTGVLAGTSGAFVYTTPTASATEPANYNRQCTIVVRMPSVVSVRTLNLSL